MTEERLAKLWQLYQQTHDPRIARRIAVWDAMYGDKEARHAPDDE